MLIQIITTVISGAFIGWLAGLLMKESGTFMENAIVGIFGSAIAGFICKVIGIYAYGFFVSILFNVLGACLFIYIIRTFFK